jgi:hypothetical protein
MNDVAAFFSLVGDMRASLVYQVLEGAVFLGNPLPTDVSLRPLRFRRICCRLTGLIFVYQSLGNHDFSWFDLSEQRLSLSTIIGGSGRTERHLHQLPMVRMIQ